MEKKISSAGLRGLLVVSLEEGLQLGKISDVHFDEQSNHIIGISYKGKRFGIGNEAFVCSDDIEKLGIDVVIVSSKRKEQPLTKAISGKTLKDLESLIVTADDGTHIGKISDLKVSNNDELKISTFILDKKNQLEIEANEITIGDDTVIVPSHYISHIEELSAEEAGIIQRLTDTAYVGETVKETVQSVGGAVKEAAHSMSTTVKKRTGKMEDTIKDTSERVGHAAKEASGKMGDRFRKTLKKNKPNTDKTKEQTEQKAPKSK